MRERFGWRGSLDACITAPNSPAAKARAAAWFSSVSAVVGLLAIALPHNPGMDELGIAVVALVAGLLAAIALVGFSALPGWSFVLGAVAATVAAVFAVRFWGTDSLVGGLPLLVPTVYAAWFLPRRAALAQVAGVGILFAAYLVLEDPAYPVVSAWVVTMATLGGVGVLLALLRDRITNVIASLTDAARRDPLTGLLNRRGFEEAFDIEIERARRTEQSLSVIVGDLDRFKLINDRHGHAAGDDALRKVGRALRSSTRSWDGAARVGGEEFAVLAPDTDEHGAYILAERIRGTIERAFGEGPPGPLTSSFGIVSYPVHGQTAETLLQAGDQALYAAKRLGRNRSVISSAEVPGILARTGRTHEESPVELATLLSLAEALDVRDSGSATHCRRVGRYSELIARELGLPPDSVERVRIAGVLHDVGRVGVPDELLAKEGPLSDDEWQWIHSHPEIGARMLETTEFADIGSWILGHHERPDGTGYPEGVAGELPLEAAILGVADAYEAMTSPRPYRASLDPHAASDELRRGAGQQFDERVVEALLRVV